MTWFFTCHCSNTGVEQASNKSQHTKLTLEKIIIPLLLLGFKLATFRSRVWHSTNKLPQHIAGKGDWVSGVGEVNWCTSVDTAASTQHRWCQVQQYQHQPYWQWWLKKIVHFLIFFSSNNDKISRLQWSCMYLQGVVQHRELCHWRSFHWTWADSHPHIRHWSLWWGAVGRLEHEIGYADNNNLSIHLA